MVTMLALVVSGASVASARTLADDQPAGTPGVQQVVSAPQDGGPAITLTPGEVSEEVPVEERLRAAHEEWIAFNEIPRRADLDAIAAEYVAGAPEAEWNYQEDVVGIEIAVIGDPGGAFVQIARFDLEEAEEWAQRGLVDEIPAEDGVPTGFAMERIGDYIYASLVFDYSENYPDLARV
ncbi:hypothetical protein COCCU_02030 [Corynebacterium occultum]|uniref:Uncharacterized protein n=1 Tax=Corynebacterium occultum TaxID=2675219 RepID=A0A6B8W4T2_9CORY|nr:hypothetical protein COCCU_02030 [Corynebacterium occultum]